MGPAFIFVFLVLAGLALWVASQLLYGILKFFPFFRNGFFKRLFFWGPIVAPPLLIGLILAFMGGLIPISPRAAYAQIYGEDAPATIEFGKAHMIGGTDFYDIYLSYKPDADLDERIFENEVSLEDRDTQFQEGDGHPDWWLGGTCSAKRAAISFALEKWDERVSIECDDGWVYAHVGWIE